MQNRLFKIFALCALLLMFGLTTGYAACATQPSNKHANKIERGTEVSTASHADNPFLRNDVPEVSRGSNRMPEKIAFAPAHFLYFVPIKDCREKLSAILPAFKYPIPFKLLFPEHAFS